jgi:CBS-domain-containing membrane protein
MIAGELLIEDFPVLHVEDELHKAVDIFLDHCICHIPVLSADNYLEGVLPIDILMEIPDKNRKIEEFRHDFMPVFAFRDQHGLEVFEIIARQELTALPVVDETRTYLGIILSQELLSRLSAYYSFKEIGGIIVLSMGIRDYNLSEISRIVESNNAKILMLYLDTDADNSMMTLTLKLNTLDLSHIIATFERFKYTIDFFHPSAQQKDEMRERYDLLMKLFDI